MRRAWAARYTLAAVLLCACTSDEVTLGEQCPSPGSGRATFASRDAGPSLFYGTSCAPCRPNDIDYDDRGCPILVTFESCGGGDICIGEVLVPKPVFDAGMDGGEEDGGAADGGDADGGEEDAGDG